MTPAASETQQISAQRLQRIEERLDNLVESSAQTSEALLQVLRFFTTLERLEDRDRQGEIDKAYQQGYADGAGAPAVEPKVYTGLRVVERIGE